MADASDGDAEKADRLADAELRANRLRQLGRPDLADEMDAAADYWLRGGWGGPH